MDKIKCYIGFDIGGTKIEACLLALSQPHSLKLLYRNRIPTQRDKGYNHTLSNIISLFLDILKSFPDKQYLIMGVGFGLPGTVEPESMRMLRGNTNFFAEHDLISDIKKNCLELKDVSFAAANDANCFALAEVYLGVGINTFYKASKIMPKDQIGVGIILGTGVGAGLVYKGKIIEGRNGSAMEVGHIPLFNNNLNCYCPSSKGCVELELSGHGLEQTSDFKLSSQEILKDQIHLNNYNLKLQKLLLTITNIINPDYFVLGGGISNVDGIYKGLEEWIKIKNFVSPLYPKVYKNNLGDSAGVFGAALLCLKNISEFENSLDFLLEL